MTIKPLINDLVTRLRSENWHRLPKLLGLLSLLQIRDKLQDHNLHDTEDPPLAASGDPDKVPEEVRNFRSFDGTSNDLRYPQMGAAGARFGRNVPLEHAHPDADNILNPSPRVISNTLLKRDQFQGVEILNLLAAAWIQFQVHDWFTHKQGTPADAWEVPVEDADDWHEKPMRVPRTPSEPTSANRPPAYRNLNTHWWDGSQVYGSNQQSAQALRLGIDGKMKIGETALLPLDVDGVELTGFSDNWWVGLSMLHSLFVSEHNAICDRLRLEYLDWDDERLFQTARLINAALMAKIHTVEWTPAILPHPTVAAALRINWHGFLGEDLQQIADFLQDHELLGGIVGSEPDPDNPHFAAPYSLTEEFVAVYRMHPLMPDEFTFRALADNHVLARYGLLEISLDNTRSVMERHSLPDLFYSFGVMHPGALRLHNYPNALRQLPTGNQQGQTSIVDLASIDVLRDRERGVPRYNQFRELLRMRRVNSFEEMTDNPVWAKELQEVYGDVDQVDTMVGMFAEPLLPGFGFSETAFRIFILMASRRLMSDRFFRTDYRAEIYTQIGIDWIRDNSMVTVLLRHHPSLQPALTGVTNAFAPWKRTGIA